MHTAVSIEKVSRRFGPFVALDNVSFEIPAQTLFGLLGPNGAGKTTLFSIVAGYLRPSSGHISVLGMDSRQVAALRGRLSVLPQDAMFQSNVPILEQLVFLSRLCGRSRHEAEQECQRVLEWVGLSDCAKKSARILSHGMAKRLGIAQAFLGEPEVIFLDEPTAGLDPANAHLIRSLVVELKKKATVVVSSHDLREIQEICSHVAILNHGQLVTTGTVDEITRGSQHFVVSLSRPLINEEIGHLTRIKGVSSVTPKISGEYEFILDGQCQDPDMVMAEVLQQLISIKAYPRRMSRGTSLESAFLELTQ